MFGNIYGVFFSFLFEQLKLYFYEVQISSISIFPVFLLSIFLFLFSSNRGENIFISVWNLHRCPKHWIDADKFNPERWPADGPNPNEINQNFRFKTDVFFYELQCILYVSNYSLFSNCRRAILLSVTYHLVVVQESVWVTCLLHLR